MVICRAFISFFYFASIASSSVLTEHLREQQSVLKIDDDRVKDNATNTCSKLLEAFSFAVDSSTSVFDAVTFAIHRNGEPQSCGVTFSSAAAVETALYASNLCNVKTPDKFQVESFLSDLFANELVSGLEKCGSVDDATVQEGLYGYCDSGPDRTVIQNDHASLVPTRVGTLPCRFYTREGRRVYSLQHFSNLAKDAIELGKTCQERNDETCDATPTVHLYAVPAGRFFMFAPTFVGEQFVLNHIQDTINGTIVMEVISVHPRVFEIYNFFTEDEAQGLVDKALADTSEVYGLHRSTTGAIEGQVFSKRTSDNAWDTDGKISTRIKRRCFETLGIDEFHVSHTDGLQILRYKNTQAYTPHPDYLSNDGMENYDFDSSRKGGNRFATVLLYMSDLGENDGGETLFSHAWPPGTEIKDRVLKHEAVRRLREAGGAPGLAVGSWEEEMTALCRTRLAIRPRKGRAVLFYSQFPNGEHDTSVLHGGCPVLNNTKWAANLWVWSAPRPEFEGAPIKRPLTDEEIAQKFDPPKTLPSQARWARFSNSGQDSRFTNAKLYYQDTFFGDLGTGSAPIAVNTFPSHEWKVVVDNKTLKTFVIGLEEEQFFTV